MRRRGQEWSGRREPIAGGAEVGLTVDWPLEATCGPTICLGRHRCSPCRRARGERLELLAPVALNVVCFRYRRPELAEEELDRVNTEILMRLQEEGIAAPSGTRVRGRFAIRVANVNRRSRQADFELLVRRMPAGFGHPP